MTQNPDAGSRRRGRIRVGADMRVNACPGGLVTDLLAPGHVPESRDSRVADGRAVGRGGVTAQEVWTEALPQSGPAYLERGPGCETRASPCVSRDCPLTRVQSSPREAVGVASVPPSTHRDGSLVHPRTNTLERTHARERARAVRTHAYARPYVKIPTYTGTHSPGMEARPLPGPPTTTHTRAHARARARTHARTSTPLT